MRDRSTDRFLESCGSVGPFRLVFEGPGGVETRPRMFHQPFVVVGRHSGMDLVLDHQDVSRRHAYLQLIAGRLFCVDLKSRTGTHWQGGPEAWGWVGQEGIRIGPYRIRLDAGAPIEGDGDTSRTKVDPLPISRSFEQPGLPALTLELLEPRAEVTTWQVSRAVVLLGGLPICRVRLTGTGVSAVHASLVRTPAGIWLVDLLSRGELLVNGLKVRCVQLDEGDGLQVGDHLFRVRAGSSAAVPARLVCLPTRRLEPSPALPAGLIASDVLPAGRDALLGPLLHEFGQMQQQMADQFQQSLMMMFRMFSGMHQDQMALIREELDGLRRLMQEMHDLKIEQATSRTVLPDQSANGLADTTPSARSPAINHLYARSAPRPSVSASSAEEVERHDVSAALFPGGSEAPCRPPVSDRPSGQPDEEIHVLLTRRIAEIQQEHQGRWQRILGTVMSLSRGGLTWENLQRPAQEEGRPEDRGGHAPSDVA